MTYEELVQKVRDAYVGADAGKVSEHVAIQFNVYGEGEGAFYLEVADGKIAIEPYEYYDRDAVVFAPAEALIDIAEGRLDIVEAFTSGRIQAEGNLGKAALLQGVVLKKSSAAKKTEEVKEAKTEAKAVEVKEEKKPEVKAAEVKKPEVKKPEPKPANKKMSSKKKR